METIRIDILNPKAKSLLTQIERFSLTACPVHEVSGTNKL